MDGFQNRVGSDPEGAVYIGGVDVFMFSWYRVDYVVWGEKKD
jgi:hypothetical protein